jgi:sugar phosphate isomerase/epimerase
VPACPACPTGIEPEPANVVDTPAKARWLLDQVRSPRLKVVLDPANLFHVEDLPRQRAIVDAAFDLLGADIVLAHARDVCFVDGIAHQVAAGAGVLDYPHYLRRLRHFRVPLLVHGLAETEVGWALAFLRGERAAVQGEAGAGVRGWPPWNARAS